MATSRTPREARELIYQSFLTYWLSTSQSEVSLVWDNIDFKTQGTEFVHVSSAHVSGTIGALGNELYRRTMILTINIWTPEGAGQRRSDELAEVVLAWVETLDIPGFRPRDPGFNEIGVFSGYYQSSVIVTLEYDALRT